MKLKKVLFLPLAFMLSSALFADQGVGVIFGDPTAVTYKTDNLVIDLGWSINNHLDVSMDYWLLNDNFVEMLDWYLGVGGKVGLRTNGDSDAVIAGARVPVGLQWWINGDWEIFGEIVPVLEVIPGIGFDLDGGIGFRYHF